MGAHINAKGKFQSDKYPTCPAGKVPLSTEDPMAWDLLWQYAQRRRLVDDEFATDLEACLIRAGFVPPAPDQLPPRPCLPPPPVEPQPIQAAETDQERADGRVMVSFLAGAGAVLLFVVLTFVLVALHKR